MIQKLLALVVVVCLVLIGWHLVQLGVVPSPAPLMTTSAEGQRYVEQGMGLGLGAALYALWWRYT